jgi:phage/plasmid-associated DNA primase
MGVVDFALENTYFQHISRTRKKKKTKVSTPQWTGPRSVQMLKDAIFKFVETPKHTIDVLKAMQHRLTTDFHQKSTPHLLPCPNGVIDLRTECCGPVCQSAAGLCVGRPCR